MTRDTLGHRIKRTLTPFEQAFMEKFYIHNNKIYQIIRIKETHKISEPLVEILCKDLSREKIRNITMTKEAFESRKHYHTKRKAYLANLFNKIPK
jgi:hypothetical protein